MNVTETIKQFDQRGRLSIAGWKGIHVRVIETENEIILKKVHIVDPLSEQSKQLLLKGLKDAKEGKTDYWKKNDLRFLEDDE